MFSQQSVYILGIVNLLLAGIAIVCVVQAEDHPEYFSLVYVAVSIFIFYMGTILVIIILQIIETYQEQQQQNQSPLETQIPIIKTTLASQLNTIIEETLTIPNKTKTHLSRSQTLPLTLSSYSAHPTASISTLSSTIKDLTNNSNELNITSTHLTLLPKYQATLAAIHKNYRSFTFVTNNHQYMS